MVKIVIWCVLTEVHIRIFMFHIRDKNNALCMIDIVFMFRVSGRDLASLFNMKLMENFDFFKTTALNKANMIDNIKI